MLILNAKFDSIINLMALKEGYHGKGIYNRSVKYTIFRALNITFE